MNPEACLPADDAACDEAGVQLNAVILHDGVVSARRAADVLRFIGDSLGKGGDVHCLTRDFGDLARAAQWRELLARSASADLLIVATRRDDELPEPVRNLLVSWSVHGPAPDAMIVGLIESDCAPGELPPGTWWYLDFVSRQAGVPLLVRAYSPAGDGFAPAVSDRSPLSLARRSA